MTRKSSTTDSRVAQALGIYRSIAACDECLARGDGVHALTAALMLPCYRADFRRLVRELDPLEENELRLALHPLSLDAHSIKSSAGHSSEARTA
ncbi:hypothetical protein [Variovorax sp. OV700]|uniref:hypothetical protein n=1 Tax=Variovorax sp. OV700 TaxID=1882826 RepID=UPI0008882E84|nr:hypothetical protein [Variovorax sp. OV700]SDI89933.1 hypothetical protein SAMN05444748_10854 [Variovorax sp. OV700]